MSHPKKEPDINQRHKINYLSDIVKCLKLTFSFEMKAWKAQLQDGGAEWPARGRAHGTRLRSQETECAEVLPRVTLAPPRCGSQPCGSKAPVTRCNTGTDGQKSVLATEIDCLFRLQLLIIKCYKLQKQMAFGLLNLKPKPFNVFLKCLKLFCNSCYITEQREKKCNFKIKICLTTDIIFYKFLKLLY